MSRDTVFDLSHWNGDVDFAAAKAAGMEAVILKATQGLLTVDPKFTSYVAAAQTAGLLVGTYHFGIDASGGEQAAHFLDVVGANPCLLVLDFEQNQSQMLVAEALEFVRTVFTKTGIWPVVYCDRLHAEVLGSSWAIETNCPLWLARYTDPGNPPPSPWTKPYMLWQYTQTGEVDGVRSYCDRDMFMGDDLQGWWATQQINKGENQ